MDHEPLSRDDAAALLRTVTHELADLRRAVAALEDVKVDVPPDLLARIERLRAVDAGICAEMPPPADFL